MSAQQAIVFGLSVVVWIELSLVGALRIGKTVAEADRQAFLP